MTVFAAASLTDAFNALGEGFKGEHPQVEISFNFAGSQQLAQQLAQGAPADVFASADRAQMDAAVTFSRVAAGEAQVFTRNRLVVVGAEGALSSLQDLAQAGLKLVLAGKEVPVGSYSLQFLEKASRSPEFHTAFEQSVLTNVVSYEENVRAVYTKVALDEADAGIVYATDIPQGNPDKLRVLEIPEALNVVVEYPIAPILDSSHAELDAAFIDFVLSPKGQAILARYGFAPLP